MECRQENNRRLTVIDGGLHYVPRLLALDFDEALSGVLSGPSDDEARAIARALDAGIEIAVVTSASEQDARAMFERLSVTVSVLSDGATAAAVERARVRIEHLAAFCTAHGIAFQDVAVVASCPEDCPMLLEVGTAIALETAGYDARVAADAVFPERRCGGLAAAIEVVVGGSWRRNLNPYPTDRD